MPNPSGAVLDRKSRPIYDALNRGDTKVRDRRNELAHLITTFITSPDYFFAITCILSGRCCAAASSGSGIYSVILLSWTRQRLGSTMITHAVCGQSSRYQ
jgi:hypothetical protein